jgi:hypothetical protein
MDPGLRQAWTEIITAGDYDGHMESIGQAQAAAELTRWMIESAQLPEGARIAIAGAGTGQLFDLLDPALFQPFRLTCADLNPVFLDRLRSRLGARGLQAEILQDDFERSALKPRPDLLLATLLLEHIDWRRGVEVIASLRPGWCGIVMQDNPPEMTSAVTPGRQLLPSIAKAVEVGHPVLLSRRDLATALVAHGYHAPQTASREVADGKRLVALLFQGPHDPGQGRL